MAEISMDVAEESVDSLANLEERIHRAVQLIHELRSENASFHDRLGKVQQDLRSSQAERDEAQQLCDEFQKENGELEAKIRRNNDELETLRDERRQVKNRIEKLMGQLDLLNAS